MSLTINKNLLIIFIKNLVKGNVKTRLASTTGDETAFNIYQHLLNHTLNITDPLPNHKIVYYSDFIPDQDAWKEKGYIQQYQQGNDLGERMQKAFQYGFNSNYSKIIIIGSDCYELTTGILQQAFQQLDDHDVVIGPAKDGGYYLLGMQKLHAVLFKNKAWSSAEVFNSTMADINRLVLSCFQLDVLNDIDVEKDIPEELMSLYKVKEI